MLNNIKLEKGKKYWLEIQPYVFYFKNDYSALLYNTISGKYIIVSDIDALAIIEEMYIKKNLGVVEICEEQFKNIQIKKFINDSIQCEICKLTIKDINDPKPIQLMPVLNLQKDIEKLSQDSERSIGEGILSYLSNITVFLNSICDQKCEYCLSFKNQFFHCYKNVENEELDFELFVTFLNKIKYLPVRRLAITGGNILKYSKFDLLISFFKQNKIYPSFGLNYLNFKKEEVINLSEYLIEIFVSFPINEEKLKSVLEDNCKNHKIIFAISNEKEFLKANELISEHQSIEYEFQPFFNGNNLNFFEKNVYIEKEDLFEDVVPQRIIFARQKLNTNFFGSLFLLPNGNIKTNMNNDHIGNIMQDDLSKIIEKEMLSTHSWRYIRNLSPCNQCLYQFLCPSPSNYEFVIGKPNLCHINCKDE